MKNILALILIFLFVPTLAWSKVVSKQEAEEAFAVFDLKLNSSLEEVRSIRDKLIRTTHPDRAGTEEFLEDAKRINVAYGTIRRWLIESGAEKDWEAGAVINETSNQGAFMTVNQRAYLALLFNSQYFVDGPVSQNMDAMFDLIYRLYSFGYTHDVLANLSQQHYNPFASSDSFKYEAAFPGLFELFGNQGGTSLVSNFQLFKSSSPTNYNSYSHILIHFDAQMTKRIGLPRFRIFMIRPNSSSADEMLALYRNHNNNLPRLQVFQKRWQDDLYMMSEDGVRSLIQSGHDDLTTIDLSIIDGGNPNPPRLVELDLGSNTNLVDANQVSLKDLGSYLSPVGMRLIRLGGDLGSSYGYGDFENLYMAVNAKDVVKEMIEGEILKKIQNANADHFLWPRLIGSAAFMDINREDFNMGRRNEVFSGKNQCDVALSIDSKRWPQ